jgi:hypothetical protein
MRIDPPVSEPMAVTERPPATADADPMLEPQQIRFKFQGLCEAP